MPEPKMTPEERKARDEIVQHSQENLSKMAGDVLEKSYKVGWIVEKVRDPIRGESVARALRKHQTVTPRQIIEEVDSDDFEFLLSRLLFGAAQQG